MTKPAKTYATRKEAALKAGMDAFREGKPLSACPINKHQGLRRSWKDGWMAASSERQKQTSGMFIAKAPPPEAALSRPTVPATAANA